MSNKNVTIKDGIINIPYNFNNEKYIVGIENKETNEIEVSKTIIPIKEAKPSYSLVITPKQYDISGSKVSPFFHVEKNKDGKYSFINSEVIYTVNFIVDDIQIPVSDYTIKTDWDKYNIIKTIEPFEIKVSVNDSATAIESGSTQYTILENSGSFDEEVNIFIDYNDIMFTTTLKTTFQKSYFETISLYDSIDIASRVNETKTMRNVITIDGYYNDNKVEKENLNVKFDLNGNDKFTTLASTMGYIDIVKEKNEWYLEHKELSASGYTGTPLCNYIVDNKGDIYEDGNLIVSGDTLYKVNNKNKIIDSSGNTYSGTTKIIDNSGNTKFNSYTTIDNSGNTKYNGTTKIIDNKNKIIYSSQGKFITNLNDNKIYSQGSGCTVDITNGKVYSGTTQNVILDEDNYIPLQFDVDKTYKYNFKDGKLISGDTTIYNNNTKQLYISGNTGYTITPSNNEYKVTGTTIIESDGDVNQISGFGYNITGGVISTIDGTALVTAITSNNKGCTNSSTIGYTFNSAYTATNYGYYISDIGGIVKYKNNSFLLNNQTVFSNSNIVAKYISSLGVRYNGFAGPIKFNFNNSGVYGATGYTYSDDLSQTGVTFKIDKNNITNNISLKLYYGAVLNNVIYNDETIKGSTNLRFVDTDINLKMNITAQNSYRITKVEANGTVITPKSNIYDFGNITKDTEIIVHTVYVDPSGNTHTQTSSLVKTSQIDTTREYHKIISGDLILVYNGNNHILTYNKNEDKILYCKFKNNIEGQFTDSKLIFALNEQINYVHEYNNAHYYYISDKSSNKLIILNVILNDEFIKLADKYWLKDKKIYYNSSPATSTTCADITSTTIGNNANTTGGTYITNGIIVYKNNNLLNSKSGCTEFSPTLRYYYKDKKLDCYYNNKNQTIVNFKENRLYYANAVKVLNLSSNYIINNSGSSLFTTDKIITIYINIKYDIDRKKVSGDASYSYDFNTENAVLINTNNLFDGNIKYQNGVTTLQYNTNNSIVISGNKINLNLNKGYTLTATTGYVNVDDANKTIITAITTNVDNRHTYTWDVESKCIKEGEDILTNINKDRPFYYCNTSGDICYNNKIVEYIIDENDEYWNISNGNKVLIKDKDKSGNSLIFKPKNGKVVPPKKEIEDKYGNIKINKKTSFDKKTGTYRDADNKVITGVTSGASQYPLDESYYTTIVDLTSGYISDANGRALMNSNGKSVYIEGGLELTRQDDGIDTISKEGIVLVSGITNDSIGDLTPSANVNHVTKKTVNGDDTYYYKNKKLYDSNGAYYFEKLITETTNTGFTLQNGIIIRPKQPEAKTRATIGGSGDRPDYTYGVEIVAGDFVVTITQKDDGQGGGGGGYYPSESGGTENPGFTITDDGLLYLGAKIVDFKDGKIYDISSLLDINNRIDFTKIPDTTIVHVDADDITIIDETGKNDVYEIEEKETVYYDSHLVENIKKYIPDLISYFFKSNKSESYNLNVETSYMGVMTDKKDYLIVDGGKNHSSYKIKVEPQFITQNMINNGSTVKAYVVNNNGDQIPYNTYSGNGYTFKYTTDTNSDFEEITGNTFIYTLSTETPIFNEIKFNLECEGTLINQEIIEVLGENKFITSTEYINNTDSGVRFKITETVNTYYKTDIIWDIEKRLTGVELSNNTLIISSGVTGTVILSGTCNNIKVYEKAIVITKNGEKGKPGDPGQPGAPGQPGEPGPQGPRGKLLYPAGRWNSGTTYDGTDEEKTPFVTYKVDNEDKYYVLTAVTEISGMDYKPTDSGWTEMTQYEALYTKLLVAENGLVGGSVYNGNYVFSKYGISNGDSTNIYSGFTDSIVGSIFSGDTSNNNFIPNYLVDFNKGRAWFGNGNTRILENGTLLSDNIIEMFNTIYLPHREMKTGSTNSTITNTSWDDWRQRVNVFEYDDEMFYCGITLNNVFYKYISQLNSLIVDHPNIGTCIKGEQNVILKLSLMDESIAETNKWYKGVIYMSEKCTNDTRIYLYIGDNNIYGELGDKYFEIYPGEKIEYLFKWSGKHTKPLTVVDTNYSTGGRYSCKYGDIIVFSNKSNRWKITKLENKIKELETQISTLLP